MTSSKANNSINVVMIVESLPPRPMGGAERQAVKLCKGLNQLGVHTELITWGKFWHPRSGVVDGIAYRRLSSLLDVPADMLSLLKPFKKKPTTKIVYQNDTEPSDAISGKVWIGMRLRYTLFYINALRYLKKKKSEFDVIHAHMMEWPAFTTVKLGKALNKPVVVKDSTMNGILSLLRYPDGKNKQAEVAGYAWCVAMTRTIRDNMLKANVPAEKIVLIPNGITIRPMPAKASAWSNHVVFVGNLTQQPAKGIDILLFAWKRVIDQLPSAHLEIIGDGDLPAYQYFTEKNGIRNVTFTGKVSNVSEKLYNADVFVLPSRREGMSNALLEAMANGLPVVATRVSGSEDLIENGISGMLTPVGDVDALAHALVEMLKNPERSREMGARGYDSVVSKCDMNKVAQAYTNLYLKITRQIG